MLLTNLHDEPLLHVFQLLHGRDICKLEHTCKRFRHISFTYDSVTWKQKCRILWERKVRDMVRMSEDIILPITILDTRDRVEMDALFDKIHVPLHEKVYAFQEVYNMKDSNKLIDKIKKIRKKRKLDAGVSSEDRLKLEASWKMLYTLDYLTEKFHGKYRKKKGPKLYLSPLLLYSPFTVPKSALPMPKARVAAFQSNRFWGNADEIYFVIKERPEPSKPRSRTNSLTGSGETTIRSFFGGRGRSNSLSAESQKNNESANATTKLSSSTNSLPAIMENSTTNNSNNNNNKNNNHKHKTSKSNNNTANNNNNDNNSLSSSSSTIITTTTTTTITTEKSTINNTNTKSVNTTTNTINTTNTVITTSINNNNNPTSTNNNKLRSNDTTMENEGNNNLIENSSKSKFDHPILLPLGHLYFENRPNGSIDTIGGMWSVIQTRKGRMLVLWRKWQLRCYAEPLMPTKLAYEWLPETAQLQPTSVLALNYEMHGPWHSGKVVSEKLWKMRPWYDQVDT